MSEAEQYRGLRVNFTSWPGTSHPESASAARREVPGNRVHGLSGK
jgi:hypothetical protein